jgi:hypothetical protein
MRICQIVRVQFDGLRPANFLLDRWLEQYQLAVRPPEFDFASGAGPHGTAAESQGLLNGRARAVLRDGAHLLEH